jgi:hypothetical protein
MHDPTLAQGEAEIKHLLPVWAPHAAEPHSVGLGDGSFATFSRTRRMAMGK